MATQIDVTNRALLTIGARAQVSSINPSDGSREADAAAILFTPTFENLGRTARWNCLRKQVSLTLIQAATGTAENPVGTSLPQPPSPWQYAYSYPADCLAVRYLVPSLPSTGTGASLTSYNNNAALWVPGGNGQINFEVGYSTDTLGNPIQIIMTNQDQAQAVYTVNQPNPAIWDSMFQEAMVSSLAAYFVPALSLNLPLMQASIQRAEAIIARARAADGNEGVHSQDNTPDWIRVRGGASRYYGVGNWNGYGYVDMAWP